MKYEYIERAKPCVAILNSRVSKHYEWYKTLEELNFTALHICDNSFSWYHQCLDRVRIILDLHKPTLLVGASMGGYAALLLGSLHGIKVKAFGPQTTLKARWDIRWEPEWEKVRTETKHPEYLDLAGLEVEADIYYCLGSKEDIRHAERLKKGRLVPRGCKRHEEASLNIQPSEIFG